MKKFITGIITFAAMTAAVTVMADTNVNVVVNGVTADQQGVILESRTMVPVRGVTEQLGFFVEWDGDTNDQAVTPDVPQAIINDRFMLPLRAMCESVGAEVEWDGDTKTAYINTEAQAEDTKDENNKADTKTEEKTEDNAENTENTEIETAIPGISIQILPPEDYPEEGNDIEF